MWVSVEIRHFEVFVWCWQIVIFIFVLIQRANKIVCEACSVQSHWHVHIIVSLLLEFKFINSHRVLYRIFKGRVIDVVMGEDEITAKNFVLDPLILLSLLHTYWLVAVSPVFTRLPLDYSCIFITQHCVAFNAERGVFSAHAIFNRFHMLCYCYFLIQVVEDTAADIGCEFLCVLFGSFCFDRTDEPADCLRDRDPGTATTNCTFNIDTKMKTHVVQVDQIKFCLFFSKQRAFIWLHGGLIHQNQILGFLDQLHDDKELNHDRYECT